MIIQLPRSLHYPITITAFLKQPNDEVPRLEPIMLYTYHTTVTEYPEFGEERKVEKKLSAQFHAPVEGRLERWMVKVGSVIETAKYDPLDRTQSGLERHADFVETSIASIFWRLRSLVRTRCSLPDCAPCAAKT
jgi:hypothetical protein